MGLIAATYLIKITLVPNLNVIDTPKPAYGANALSGVLVPSPVEHQRQL